MTSPVSDREAAEGGTVTIRVQVQEADGTAADLSGWSGAMQVRPTLLSDDVLATGTVVIGSGGMVTAQVAAADTLDWTVGFYDVRITNGTLVEYIARGKITLKPTVTVG